MLDLLTKRKRKCTKKMIIIQTDQKARQFSIQMVVVNNWAATWDFQQCGILTDVDSDEPLQYPFKLRNSKRCAVIEYSND